MYATACNKEKEVDLLLNKKADPFTPNKFGNSALFIALSENNTSLAQKFIKTAYRSKGLEVPEPIKSEEDEELFYFFLASNMRSGCELREVIEFNTELARVCFAHATEAYETLGNDPSILFDGSEF